MRILIVFLFRMAFLPFSVSGMAVTAVIEFMLPNPDWQFWKDYNKTLIESLPWSRYT